MVAWIDEPTLSLNYSNTLRQLWKSQQTLQFFTQWHLLRYYAGVARNRKRAPGLGLKGEEEEEVMSPRSGPARGHHRSGGSGPPSTSWQWADRQMPCTVLVLYLCTAKQGAAWGKGRMGRGAWQLWALSCDPSFVVQALKACWKHGHGSRQAKKRSRWVVCQVCAGAKQRFFNYRLTIFSSITSRLHLIWLIWTYSFSIPQAWITYT